MTRGPLRTRRTVLELLILLVALLVPMAPAMAVTVTPEVNASAEVGLGVDGLLSADCTVGIGAPGVDLDCTITPPLLPDARLTVYKQVVNDHGGSAAASSFQLTVVSGLLAATSFPGD